MKVRILHVCGGPATGRMWIEPGRIVEVAPSLYRSDPTEKKPWATRITGHAKVGAWSFNAQDYGWVPVEVVDELHTCGCLDGHLAPAPKGAVDQTGRCTTCGGNRQAW